MRLIDADELKRNHMFYHEVDNRSYAEERDIDETPTIDAVEVKHGEWIELTDKNERKYSHICSNCHRFHIDEGEIGYYHYCPNCGAKMDGEVKSE